MISRICSSALLDGKAAEERNGGGLGPKVEVLENEAFEPLFRTFANGSLTTTDAGCPRFCFAILQDAGNVM